MNVWCGKCFGLSDEARNVKVELVLLPASQSTGLFVKGYNDQCQMIEA